MLGGPGLEIPEHLYLLMAAALIVPGTTGMAVTGICAWLLRSRGAAPAMFIWGIALVMVMYATIIPFFLFLEWMGPFEFVDDNSEAVAIGYCLVWYLVIIAIAVMYRARRGIRGPENNQPDD